MQNSAQTAGVNIADPVPLGQVVDIPPGPQAQTIPQQRALSVQPVHVSGPGVTPVDILSLFNIFVGLMVVAAVLLFVGGLIVWVVRLGTIGRAEGVRIMEWGVVIAFVLVVVLAVVQFFVGHPAATTMAISAIIIFIIGYIVVQIIKSSGASEEKAR